MVCHATGSSFDEQMYIICYTLVKSKKVSALVMICDKRWEHRGYSNIDVNARLIFRIGEPQTPCARKEGELPQTLLIKFHVCIPHS